MAHEQLSERLYVLDRRVRAAGMRPLTAVELRQAAAAIQSSPQYQAGDRLPNPPASRIAGQGPFLTSEASGGNALLRSSQPFERLPLVSLQGGGTVRQPVFAVIGERGPEVALLQRGSTVFPLPQLAAPRLPEPAVGPQATLAPQAPVSSLPELPTLPPQGDPRALAEAIRRRRRMGRFENAAQS